MASDATDPTSDDYTAGYDPEMVREGEVYRKSPLTGITYRVTRWVEKPGGGIVALEKEEVDND